jgi:hypothetical protein
MAEQSRIIMMPQADTSIVAQSLRCLIVATRESKQFVLDRMAMASLEHLRAEGPPKQESRSAVERVERGSRGVVLSLLSSTDI